MGKKKIPINRVNKLIIYKTTNLINDKIYIGQNSNDNKSYFGSGDLIKCSIKKYGKKNHVKVTLEECNSQDELNERERYWIKKLNSTNKEIGYNITIGGTDGTMLNRKHSEETKRKMSKSHKGKILSEEHKNKLSELHKDKKLSEEHKNKISRALKGRKNKPLSDETKIKISEAHKGKFLSDVTKLKMSNTRKGENNGFFSKNHSEFTKDKIRKKIIQLTPNGEFIREWSSVSIAAEILKINISGISSVLNGKYKTSGGFKFIYK